MQTQGQRRDRVRTNPRRAKGRVNKKLDSCVARDDVLVPTTKGKKLTPLCTQLDRCWMSDGIHCPPLPPPAMLLRKGGTVIKEKCEISTQRREGSREEEYETSTLGGYRCQVTKERRK